MKRLGIILASLTCLFVLSAFSIVENSARYPNVDNTPMQNDDEYMREKMAELNFSEIDIDVEYQGGKEFEAEIDQDRNEPILAKVEDDLNNVYLRGREAFDHIFERANKLDVTSNSTKQQIIDQVLNAFDLPNDYIKIDVEIEFDDGKKVDIEDRK
ncbi:YusW family protein [Pseudogracilibacillus sp. SO30301A]|uniref:YusW family protein n=1 Tax=Pseudogracilibacillus sp. SO30301A TaxID=3098291 RepID=UPI00300DF66B